MNRRYCNGMVHVIKQGETLYQLSRRYRVPLALILRANPYVDVYNLQVGQEICIPVARPYNGMICMPVQGMNRANEMMQDGMNGQRTEEDQQSMREEMQDAAMEMESEPSCEESMPMDHNECKVCDSDMVEKNDKEDSDDVEIYITTGDRSLGDILEEYGVDWEDFVKNNNLSQIVISEDVVLYLPKKNAR